jgi:hypothetical protein
MGKQKIRDKKYSGKSSGLGKKKMQNKSKGADTMDDEMKETAMAYR